MSSELIASDNDTVLQQVRQYTQHGWPSRITDVHLQPYHQVRHELSVWNDVCLARDERAVIPTILQPKVLSMAHEGHLGMVKTKQKCRSCVWWPGIERQTEEHIRQCEACIQSGKSLKPTKSPLQPVEWPQQPWQKIQIDIIIGELHGAPQSHKFIIVVHDLHSKWPEIHPCSNISSKDVIPFLCDLFTRWGLPDRNSYLRQWSSVHISGIPYFFCQTRLSNT